MLCLGSGAVQYLAAVADYNGRKVGKPFSSPVTLTNISNQLLSFPSLLRRLRSCTVHRALYIHSLYISAAIAWCVFSALIEIVTLSVLSRLRPHSPFISFIRKLARCDAHAEGSDGRPNGHSTPLH